MSLLGFDPNKYKTASTAQPKPNEQGRFGDVVDSFQAGAASGLGGIFDFLGAEGVAKSLYGIADDQYGQMSNRGQEAMSKQMFTENAQGETELGEGMTDLDTWLLQMANVAGQFVPTAVPGAGAAGLATKALSLGSTGAKVAQAVGMGATGGSAATGQAMEQARQEVLKMPDNVLADSDLFKRTFLEIDAQSPELDDLGKWNQAKNQLAERVASEVRSDPKALLTNFTASAIGDPVIGRALTGVRLAKSGAFRSALVGGVTEGATEATQSGVSQYAVDSALSQIDQRDPMAGVKLAALNEGIIGAGFGAGVGGIGGLANRNMANREPANSQPAKNPAADPIRETNPTVAGAMDADAQQAADRRADIDSMAQASQARQSSQPNYDQPTAARRAGMGDTMDAGRFGDDVIARDNAMKGRSFPTVPEQFKPSPLTQAMDNAQGITDQRREGEWLPPEGQGRSPVTGLLAAPFIDGENLSRQRTRDTMAAQPTNLISQSDTIFANDGRARQAAQQFADTTARQTATQPKQITDKGIIFAPDESVQGVTVKASGLPFASAKEALISKTARAAKREGAEIEAVKLDNGFGWRVVPKTEPEAINNNASGLKSESWGALRGGATIDVYDVNQIRTDQKNSVDNGFGIYITEHSPTAELYADKSKGSVQQLNIVAPRDSLLNRDKMLSEQSEYIKSALNKEGLLAGNETKTGAWLYDQMKPKGEVKLSRNAGAITSKAASEKLLSIGIRGMTYNANHGAGTGTHHVLFSGADITNKPNSNVESKSELEKENPSTQEFSPNTPSSPTTKQTAEPAQDLAGDKIDNEWTAFAPETGTLNTPRSEMPQIKAEHRGAMVNFMKARGIEHSTEEVPADSLKPTQAEFSPSKVKKALGFDGGDRSILVSSDNHVLDGHHQWLAKREKGEDIKVIRLNAPIKQLIDLAHEFPSSSVDTSSDSKAKATGKTAKVYTPSNKEIETEYQLIEAGDLVASHDFSGKEDARYPKERQPRDRSRASSQLQIAAIANNPNPERLADSAESDRGAPIIAGNVVESGNGRTIGIKEAYARGTASQYRQYIEDNAVRFGLSPEQVRAMQNPVLVRQRKSQLSEDEIRAFTVDSNKAASLELSPMEAAKSDAKAISDDMLDLLSVPDDGNVISPTNRQFVQAFTKRMNQQELARYLTADGGFNKDFGTRLERAIFAKAYDNDALLEQVAEAATTEQKNLINSLTNVAGKMSQLRNVAPEVWQQISGIISDATGLVMRSRRQGKPISELVSQGDMMTGYVPKEVDTLASAIDANIRSGKKITTLLDSVMTSLINANSNQGSMFDAEPLTVEQAISYVEQQQATQSEPKPSGDLFGANPARLETRSQGATDRVQPASERSSSESRQELTPSKDVNSDIDANTFIQKQNHDTQTDQAATDHIADFGEKIGGARKDVWSGFSEAIKDQQNTKELPLSKSWPEPDYQELADNGTDREALALIAAMRAQIPPKPRMTYKVERWANNVNELKTMALSLIDGSLSVEQVKKAMSTKSSDLSGIANAAPVLAKADLGLLKGVANYRIQSGRFTVFGGKEYPQGKNLYFISRDGRTMYDGSSETLSEVQALLSKIINADQESGAAGPKAKQSKIDVYTDRYTKQAFLGWKGAKGVLRIKTFESVPAAREYLKQNRDEVESTLTRMKETPNERRVENAARIGPERFAGNVTPAIFADTFGFRGVEFGNYVEQVKRQKDLNQAYDALMDLAEVIDIPPKAISLNGELGLAFGARGKGGSLGGGLTAAAHYEPGNIVINLTKKAGAGSLAHEWYHALDNYFSRKRGDASSFISERPYPLMNKGVREEVLEAFKGIKKAIYQSELVSRAKALDSRRSTAYWSTDIELGARAFESFVIAELERKGMTNDYLANIVSQEYWDAAESLGLEDGSTYPYPNQIEASSINAAYQSLFETIDVREGDSGNIDLFSKASKGANRGARLFTQAEAQRAVDDVLKRLSGAAGIRVNLFTSQDEFLSRFNVPAMAMEGQTIYGAYDDRRNSAYLILDNFSSIDELRSTLVHEVLAHGGLHTVIGTQKYQQFIDKLNSSRSRKEFKELWAKIDKDYNGASDAVKAEEVFANFVQNQPERGTAKAWWFELTKWLRRQLEGLGIIKSNITRNEMEDMMQAIVRGFDKRKQRMDRANAVMERGGKQPDSISYSKSGSVTDTPEFKRWFGDSKVVDENGDPLVVYHGSPSGDISIFKSAAELGLSGESVRPYDTAGLYFSPNQDMANTFASNFGRGGNGTVYPVYLAMKNPLIVGDSVVESSGVKGVLNRLAMGKKRFTAEQKLNGFRSGDSRTSLITQADIQLLKDAGYDGVINETDFEYIVFSPTQIKSATGNNGNFDSSNPDIRFSMDFGDDTRTAKQKLGLEEEAEQTLKEKITENYRNTADTLKQSSFWQRLNEGIFDGLHGIKKAEEAAGITDPNKMGYVSARLASGLSDVLHGVFHYGAPMWKDGIIQRKADTKGLLEVFGMLPDGELNNWLAWMGANRAKQLKAEGRENNLSQADIDELLALADGKEKLFEEVRAEYNKINSAVLDVAQGAGLISEAQRAGFDEEYYVPFFREQDVDPEMQDIASMVTAPFTKKGIAGQSAKIKALKGGKQSTKDLLENIILRQSTMLDAALKNKAMLEVADNLDGTQFMTQVDSPEFAKLSQRELNSIQRVKVMRDGQAVAYAVTDPALLRGLIAVNDVGSQALFNRMGRSAKRFLTAGVTLSPDFIFKNFIRDAAHAWMINKDDFKFGTDSIKGLKKAFKEDEAYRDLIFSGAAFQGGYVHGADPEAAAQQIRRALAKKGLTAKQIDGYMGSLVTNGKMLLEKYRNASDKVENANRLSTYEASLAAGKSRRQAAFEAKDLMDYSLKGNFALISTMIDFLPFFNARLQGMYKLARASAAGENDKVLKVLSANLAMKGLKVAAFSLALAAMNDDDDRYKELPDWDKDANWHFWIGDDHFRIPKPFELGVVFGTMPERLFGFGTGSQTGSDLGRATANAVFNTMALNPIPQIALPVVEVMTNKSFFKGTAIEGMGDENRMPGDRYNAYTSDTAREVGQLLNVSPKKIEHLINGYAGTLGGYVLAMSDMMARQMLGKEKPETPISRYPVIKAFYGGDAPKGNTYYQNEFYKALDAANQAYGSYKRAAEEQDSSRMMAVLEDNRDKLGVRIALNRVQRQVSALSKQAEMVNNSSMGPSEKREKLDAITRQKNAIYQSAYVGFNLREW